MNYADDCISVNVAGNKSTQPNRSVRTSSRFLFDFSRKNGKLDLESNAYDQLDYSWVSVLTRFSSGGL